MRVKNAFTPQARCMVEAFYNKFKKGLALFDKFMSKF